MKKFLINLSYGYMLSIFLMLSADIKNGFLISDIEVVKETLLISLILAPFSALLIYLIKAIGIPLIKEFIEGSLLRKIFLIFIVITLIKLKF